MEAKEKQRERARERIGLKVEKMVEEISWLSENQREEKD